MEFNTRVGLYIYIYGRVYLNNRNWRKESEDKDIRGI